MASRFIQLTRNGVVTGGVWCPDLDPASPDEKPEIKPMQNLQNNTPAATLEANIATVAAGIARAEGITLAAAYEKLLMQQPSIYDDFRRAHFAKAQNRWNS